MTAMTSAQLRLLANWLLLAIMLGLIAWRLWRRRQTLFPASEAALLKRTPEGWTFDSPYPRVFSQRRWTYLLTDAQKERLTEGLRCWVRSAALATSGVIILLAIALAISLPKLPDLPRWLLAGGPGVWLWLLLVFVLVCGTPLATAVFIAQKRWVHPVLRDAIRLTAEATSVRELRNRIIWDNVVLLASMLAACMASDLSPSSLDAKLLLVMGLVFGSVAICYVANDYTFAKTQTHQNGDAMNDEGILKLQPSGRWAVCRPWRPPAEIENGDIFRVDVDGDLKLTQMGYRRFAGGGGEYYSVDGFKLRDGLRAAIGTGEDPALYLRELVLKAGS